MSLNFRPQPEDGNRFYDRCSDPGEVRARTEHRDITFVPTRDDADGRPVAAPEDEYRPRRRSLRSDCDHEAPEQIIGPEGDDE